MPRFEAVCLKSSPFRDDRFEPFPKKKTGKQTRMDKNYAILRLRLAFANNTLGSKAWMHAGTRPTFVLLNVEVNLRVLSKSTSKSNAN
jgi:hypothetical protein